MKKLLIFILLFQASFVLAEEKKKKKEKTSQEAISELKAQLFELEKYAVLEKYEREIANYKPSKAMKSKLLLLSVKAERTKYPKAKQRMPIIKQIIRIHQSFIDNKVPEAKRRAVAKSLRDKFIADKLLDEETIKRLSQLLPLYLGFSMGLTHKDHDFAHLIQGATYAHAKVMASKGGGKEKAKKIFEKGKPDRYGKLTYKKYSRGHWTLTASEKMELQGYKKGYDTKKAKKYARLKQASNKHCENYTGTTVTCEGQLFIKATSAQIEQFKMGKKPASVKDEKKAREELEAAKRALKRANSKVID